MKSVDAGEENPPGSSQEELFQQGKSKKMSREERRKSFALLIQDHLPLAVRVGALNLPLVDITALSFVQLSLLRKIATMHGLDFLEARAQEIRTELLSDVDSLEPISEGFNELGLQQLSGSLDKKVTATVDEAEIQSTTVTALSAAASTYALAKVIFEHLDKGGSLSSFDVDSQRGRFTSLFREGRAHPLSMLELSSLGY